MFYRTTHSPRVDIRIVRVLEVSFSTAAKVYACAFCDKVPKLAHL